MRHKWEKALRRIISIGMSCAMLGSSFAYGAEGAVNSTESAEMEEISEELLTPDAEGGEGAEEKGRANGDSREENDSENETSDASDDSTSSAAPVNENETEEGGKEGTETAGEGVEEMDTEKAAGEKAEKAEETGETAKGEPVENQAGEDQDGRASGAMSSDQEESKNAEADAENEKEASRTEDNEENPVENMETQEEDLEKDASDALDTSGASDTLDMSGLSGTSDAPDSISYASDTPDAPSESETSDAFAASDTLNAPETSEAEESGVYKAEESGVYKAEESETSKAEGSKTSDAKGSSEESEVPKTEKQERKKDSSDNTSENASEDDPVAESGTKGQKEEAGNEEETGDEKEKATELFSDQQKAEGAIAAASSEKERSAGGKDGTPPQSIAQKEDEGEGEAGQEETQVTAESQTEESQSAPAAYQNLPTVLLDSGESYETVDPGDFDLTEDNEELFAGYVDKVLEKSLSTSSRIQLLTAGRTLTGQNQIIYEKLETLIQKVADGEEANAVLDIKMSDLLEKTTYTASELGISSVYSNNSITEEAKTALLNKLSYNTNTIYHALLTNHPYELYWHDKTLDGSFYISGAYGYSADPSANTITLTEDSKLTFRFYVAKAYSESDTTGTSVADTTKTGATQQAVTNAKAIVDENENYSDYEKLVKYKDAICERVSYNTAALENANTTPYGDPWQLIYVFDNDTTNQVVCEGYSKAFKYLCDLSDFQSSLIDCYIATGTMNGGTGAGAHMWNLIHMDNEENYLVDVTNCDEGSVGTPNYLFLVGSSDTTADGYTIHIPVRTVGSSTYQASSISYVYDSDTQKQYYEEELLIATANYDVNATPTPTPSPTVSPTPSAAPTPTAAPTPSAVSTPTPMATPTVTPSPIATPTAAPTITPTAVPATPTAAATATPTPAASLTPTTAPSPTAMPTAAPSPTATPTTATPTAAPTITPTAVPATPTAAASATPAPTANLTPAAVPTATPVPAVAQTPTPSASVTPAPTVLPSVTATPTIAATATPAVAVTPTATATPSPAPGANVTPEPGTTPVPGATVTSAAVPSPAVTPVVTATPSPTAVPVPSPSTASVATATPTPISQADRGEDAHVVLEPEVNISSALENREDISEELIDELQAMASSASIPAEDLSNAVQEANTEEGKDENSVKEELAQAAKEITKKINTGEIKDVPQEIQEALEQGGELQGYAITYLDIEVLDYQEDENGELAVDVDIQPVQETLVAVAGKDASGLSKDNAISTGDKKSIRIKQALSVEVQLPNIFRGRDVYVKHTKDYAHAAVVYWYQASYNAATGKCRFLNPHGFSAFSFTTVDGALIWDQQLSVGYETLQSAIDGLDESASAATLAVQGEVASGGLAASVSRELSLRLTGLTEAQLGVPSLAAGEGYAVSPATSDAAKAAAIRQADGTYQIQFEISKKSESTGGSGTATPSGRQTRTSGGGSGGGSSSGGGGSSSGGGSIASPASMASGFISPSSGQGAWVEDEKGWRVRKADGSFASNEWYQEGQDESISWFRLGADGYMLTGWYSDENGSYYLNPVSDGSKGKMLTGWQFIDGCWYFFEPTAGRNQGHLYRNENTPDAYYVDQDGVWKEEG